MRVLITGASSGIGQALAMRLADGSCSLHLGGRDPARLEATAAACRERGAAVLTELLDVRDAAGMAAWIGGAGPLDLVIANAGISPNAGEGALETAEQVRAVMATNLDGVVNTVLPALEVMTGQPADPTGVRGRIAAIASLGAFVASPMSPAYCASKAAVDSWLVATAPAARRCGILLTSVCPGFIRTPMVEQNRFPMPGLMDADRCARIALAAIEAGRRRVAFPWFMYLGAQVASLLPARFAEHVMVLREKPAPSMPSEERCPGSRAASFGTRPPG
ncbi:MAG: SDR family NAD(P)-dependent oxidoreductase [Acidisphaera sp.]|nr:SDR family NAD(P)-dependent oxidoreductase [Acidisphaera sp.]